MLQILVAHFIGDFILQSNWMALNKHRNWLALGAHALAYMLTLSVLLWNPQFGLIQGALHFAVDAVTSRMTHKLWLRGQRRVFFIVIGLDQLIHQACLLGIHV